MTLPADAYMKTRWAMSLEELDREIARLATLCQIRLLDRGVVERVMHGDDWVCGADNPIAFRKLRELLLMHFALLEKESDAVGLKDAAAIEQFVIERLKKSFPGLAAPPADEQVSNTDRTSTVR